MHYSRKLVALSHDVLLIGIMVILGACGIIYEYLLSHYAGRIIGLMEHAIFIMMGIMIVSMGVGALLVRWIVCSYTSFAWLELLITLIGVSSLFLMTAFSALVHWLPDVLAVNYRLPLEFIATGSLTASLKLASHVFPFVIGGVLGILIGMEIPLIARIRQEVHKKNLQHNIGTIYGADYIGAGIGTAIFVFFMLRAPIHFAVVFTAGVNLLCSIIFIQVYRQKIRLLGWIVGANILVFLLLLVFFQYGTQWHKKLEGFLYSDKIILSVASDFQHIVLTSRLQNQQQIYSLYLNGHLQFSSLDEHIYHAFLVHPAMLAAARYNKVLIVGGGDGLAVRNVLRWPVEEVKLLELDKEMLKLFSQDYVLDGEVVNRPLLTLNEHSLRSEKVKVIYGDAFNTSSSLKGELFDVIIVDLPDPNQPQLNKLYSVAFYKYLYSLLAADGAMVVQSTSPYHTKEAFLTVYSSLVAAGFITQSYQYNVPSFGQWGWNIATKYSGAKERILDNSFSLAQVDAWLTKEQLIGAFAFGRNFFTGVGKISPNYLGSHLMYWRYQEGNDSSGVTRVD